ncbi:MAG: glycosyltransferase family 2 protein [Halorhabdus sp.]
MELSIVVPTLDGREQLVATLDSIATDVPAAEVIVVNGPSTDGTTGMVRDRSDVDVLVELADRSVNAARNAGIDRATGDVIALLNQGHSLTDGWFAALEGGLQEAAVVTGPSHRSVRAGKTTEAVERQTIAGRSVTYLNPGNLALAREAIDDLDGFDEYLDVGGARDLAHRIAGTDYTVAWKPELAVERVVGADGGNPRRDWRQKYRSLAYRLLKNYGLRPASVARLCRQATVDGSGALSDVFDGEQNPSTWLASGRDVLAGIARGGFDGLVARARDRSARRNPQGRSSRRDRTVAVYEPSNVTQ